MPSSVIRQVFFFYSFILFSHLVFYIISNLKGHPFHIHNNFLYLQRNCQSLWFACWFLRWETCVRGKRGREMTVPAGVNSWPLASWQLACALGSVALSVLQFYCSSEADRVIAKAACVGKVLRTRRVGRVP